jgi:hypothetical protein
MSSTLQPGTTVQICGLQTAAVAHLNGVEGVIDHYSKKRDRYAVSLPGGPMMVCVKNMKVVPATGEAVSSLGTIFRGEEEMMQRLKAMGMSEEQLGNLTAEQRKAMLAMTMREDIIQKAQNAPGVIAPATELTMEQGGLYGWRDVKTHVYLEMACDKVEGGVHCAIEAEKIHITEITSGATLLQGELFQSVDAEKSVWEVADGKLIVTLIKEKPMRWLMVIRS